MCESGDLDCTGSSVSWTAASEIKPAPVTVYKLVTVDAGLPTDAPSARARSSGAPGHVGESGDALFSSHTLIVVSSWTGHSN